jgi:hypothetical protein
MLKGELQVQPTRRLYCRGLERAVGFILMYLYTRCITGHHLRYCIRHSLYANLRDTRYSRASPHFQTLPISSTAVPVDMPICLLMSWHELLEPK